VCVCVCVCDIKTANGLFGIGRYTIYILHESLPFRVVYCSALLVMSGVLNPPCLPWDTKTIHRHDVQLLQGTERSEYS